MRLIETKLYEDQLHIFDTIMDSISQEKEDRIFFVDGPGGSGNTFVDRALIHTLIGNEFNILPVAWTEIASILLPGGLTSHGAFTLPINIYARDSCFVKEIDKAHLTDCHVIIWDEASMISKRAVEMVDYLLRDSMDHPNEFLGEKYVIFGGDCRQTLPVIKYGSRTTIVRESLRRADFWPSVKQLKLTKNMRCVKPELSDWLLNIDGIFVNISDVPENWKTENVCEKIYGSEVDISVDLGNNVVLACHNSDVHVRNSHILKKVNNETFT